MVAAKINESGGAGGIIEIKENQNSGGVGRRSVIENGGQGACN